jgi:hypothetical protein
MGKGTGSASRTPVSNSQRNTVELISDAFRPLQDATFPLLFTLAQAQKLYRGTKKM